MQYKLLVTFSKVEVGTCMCCGLCRHRSRSKERERERHRYSRSPPVRRDRPKSPSPHSVRPTHLKNKITDTSLFAEMVKDRHKREKALKLLEQKDDVDGVLSLQDIPVPVDSSSMSPVDLKDVPLPNNR